MASSSTYSINEWLILSAYIVLGILGATGNGFILLVIYKRPSMRTTTFYLLANQCVSDMCCGLLYLSLWFFCSAQMLASTAGWLNCEVLYTLKVSTFFVSVLTMMAISIERYVKLTHLQAAGLSRWGWITGIWLAGICISVFAMFNFRTARFFTAERLVGCRLAYEMPGGSLPFFEQHYNIIPVLLLGCALPLAITGHNYWKVIRKIRERKVIGGTAAAAAGTKNKRKTTEMLIVMLVFYCLLCFPLYIILLISYFVVPILPPTCNSSTEEPLYFLVAYFLCVTSITVNPAIYCYYKREFRAEGRMMLNWICRRRLDVSTSVMEEETEQNSSQQPQLTP